MTKCRYQNHLIVGVSVLAVGMAMAIVQYKVPTILVNVMEMYGLDGAGGSWLMSIFTLMTVFTALVCGALSQRFSPKLLIVIATAFIVAGSALGAFAPSGAVLLVSRGLEGIALSMVTTCGPIVIQRSVDPRKIGSTMGIWGVWGPLGSVIAALLTPTLFVTLGFTNLWLTYAVIAIAATAIMTFVVRPPAQDAHEDEEAPAPANGAKPGYRALFTKSTLLFFVGFAAFNLVMLAVLSFVPTILQAKGMSATESGFMSTLPMLLSVVSSPLFGALSDRTGKTKLLLVVTMGFLGPCAFVLYNFTGAALWAAAIVMGLVGMGCSGLMLTGFTEVLPDPRLMSIGMGVLITVQGIGQFLGTFLVQALLGPGLDNCFLAGLVVMVLALVGTACIAFCTMRRV